MVYKVQCKSTPQLLLKISIRSLIEMGENHPFLKFISFYIAPYSEKDQLPASCSRWVSSRGLSVTMLVWHLFKLTLFSDFG